MIRMASRLTPVAVSDVTVPGVTSVVDPQISLGGPRSGDWEGQLLIVEMRTQQMVRGRREEREPEFDWLCWTVRVLV